MRLIDADALMKDLGITDFECTKCAWKGVYGCSRGNDFTDTCFFLENAPTVDAVPVIRCKDCAYFNGDGHYCDYDSWVQTYDYCSKAKRKE